MNGLQVMGYNITTVGGISPYSSTTDTVSLTVATLASSPAYKGTAGDDVINASVGPTSSTTTASVSSMARHG